MGKKRILITYVEAGMGHIMTAKAIADALKKNYGGFEIIEENLFHKSELLKKQERFFVNEVKKASKYRFYSYSQFIAMKIFGPQTSLKFVYSTIYRKQRNAYIDEIKRINPDIIIDTHYFCSHCSVLYREKYNKNCKVITYNPDNNVHGWWDRRVDSFIVNNELAKNEAIKMKFPSNKVKQVYFITRQAVVECNNSKEFYREKYNIPQDKFAVKLADGVYAEAKMKDYVYELIKTQKPLTIVAIAGKNKKLYEQLTYLKDMLPSNITLLPFEFVPEVYEICRACDLFITKGGPNAILDSVFVQTPIVVNYYASLIEKKTTQLFVDQLKCGLYIPQKKKAFAFVESCIDNPSQLNKFINNEKMLDKNKNGAEEIAKIVVDML